MALKLSRDNARRAATEPASTDPHFHVWVDSELALIAQAPALREPARGAAFHHVEDRRVKSPPHGGLAGRLHRREGFAPLLLTHVDGPSHAAYGQCGLHRYAAHSTVSSRMMRSSCKFPQRGRP